MGVKTYSPKDILVTVGGAIITGYANGAFVQVEQAEDQVSLVVGSDGEATRTVSANRSGSITITLQQTSESNAILSGFHQRDMLDKAGIFPVLVKDNLGKSLYTAETAWVRKMPNAEFGNESGTREWVIDTDRLIPFEGGN